MAFAIRERDLLARIGRLETKSGSVETPLLFPVVNVSIQPISPRRISDVFGCEALITNAYILKRRFKNLPIEKGIHRFLDFDGVIMTDSGAYQILLYEDVEIDPDEIVQYQEQIKADIATILDWPTGWHVTREHAEETVNTTSRRSTRLFETRKREDILWVGPVQGGTYLDLVTRSAQETAELPFHVHALGSPTEIMQNYRYDILVDMIVAAKINLPMERPLHLFGAGHPLMFSLAVALGCDLFDSAAYAIYARKDRYMTQYGTYRLSELEYFPCSCPNCTKATPKQIREMPERERETFLAEHNLFTCQAEIRRIKHAIKNGSLWEHLEAQAHVHPTLLRALKKIGEYEDLIERHSPTVKHKGMFYFNSTGLIRPEIVRYRNRVVERYSPHSMAKVLLLIPQSQTKPFHKSRAFRQTANLLRNTFKGQAEQIHVCFYAAPFGVIPIELDEIYPLSQHEIALPFDKETVGYVSKQVENYIDRGSYEAVVLIHDPENWNRDILNICRKTCKKQDIRFRHLKSEKQAKPMSVRLNEILMEILVKPN